MTGALVGYGIIGLAVAVMLALSPVKIRLHNERTGKRPAGSPYGFFMAAAFWPLTLLALLWVGGAIDLGQPPPAVLEADGEDV